MRYGKEIFDRISTSVLALMVLAGAILFTPTYALAVEAITTVTDFLGATQNKEMGNLPYILCIAALILIPIATQLLKQATKLPKWVMYTVPTVISLITASITSVANGFMPWSSQGLELVLAMVLGGGTGQGAYMINRAKVKRAEAADRIIKSS